MNLEERYLVIKHADLCRSGINDEDLATLMRILTLVDEGREKRGKPPLQSIVIEHDWPEYTPTLELLSARVDAESPRSIAAKPTFAVPYGVGEPFKHSAEDIAQAVALYESAQEHGLQVEVLMTYSNSLRYSHIDQPHWSYTQHMLYALGEWDI